MRSDREPYYACTSPAAIAHLLEMAELSGIDLPEKEALKKAAAYEGETIAIASGSAAIEERDAREEKSIDFAALERYTGGPAALVPNKLFEELLKDLPVIARNQLENGESKNLWYEEVLPRKSRLFTILSFPDHVNEADAALLNHFERLREALTDGNIVQIGANASVGYGVCTFEEVAHA
jgi:CRISPR-associated protein Cmr4